MVSGRRGLRRSHSARGGCLLRPQTRHTRGGAMTQTITKRAIAGGTPVRSQPFPRYNTIGEAEKRAVAEVLDSAVLSEFLGQWTPQFYGGQRVQALEKEW